ncbi:MAG: Yip1 family protein [Candidatus Margulisiibacteriota bacterium]
MLEFCKVKDIFDRIKKLAFRPKETWLEIKKENNVPQEILVNFVAPLALIPFVLSLFNLTILGLPIAVGRIVRAPFIESLLACIVSYFLNLSILIISAWWISYLAQYFNSKTDMAASTKLIAYSMLWSVCFFLVFPGIGVFQLIGIYGFYGVYLIYLGLPILLDTPPEKRMMFTILISLSYLFIALVLSVFGGGILYGPMFIRMMAS